MRLKAKLDCALRLPDGKLRHKVVENTAAGFEVLRAWLASQGATSVHVCLEATGVYWEPVAEFLAGFEPCTVSVVNPAQIKAFGASQLVRTKTDKVDAKLIAQFCCERCPPAWQVPTPAEQALRASRAAPGRASRRCARRSPIAWRSPAPRSARGLSSTSIGWIRRSSGGSQGHPPPHRC